LKKEVKVEKAKKSNDHKEVQRLRSCLESRTKIEQEAMAFIDDLI